MRGRPRKEVTRDTVFKVRLNAEEVQMLTCVSKWTGQPKSEVIRIALKDYYTVKCNLNQVTEVCDNAVQNR